MEPLCQLWPWAVLVLLAAPQLLGAQRACSQGACFPAPGDLLLGRAPHLRASSTCGLSKPETYCTPHGEWSMKCCRCDSRLPHSYNGHRVENVLSSAGRARWWQSQNGVERVSLQLDLEQTFQLDSVVLHFRSPPAAMLIERSVDAGRTWQVLQYLASDCATAFPRVPRGPPEGWQDPRCQELQGHPVHGGTVKFSVRDLGSTISSSYSQAMEKLGPFTNLRINFTELPHIPRQGYHSPSTFYAVTEMQVLGSCFCHGHAESCTPAGNQHSVVPGHCVCQHNTAGPHCERCAALFNARPWAPAQDSDPHECQRCDCNGHSSSCHFDPELYQASGGASGGVCDHCQHNTEGNNCERCKTNYFRNPRQELSHPEACLPCECDPDGTVPGSACDPGTGRCVCKDNVQGDRCHLCKPGFAQLAAANPAGCRRCTCNALGTRQDTVPCDGDTGSCFCLPNVVGSDCGQCAAGHWGLASGQGCQPCACHPHGSHSPHCNQFTGQCPCRDGFTGQTCSALGQQQCPARHYRDARGGCTECDCDFQGTEELGCDRATGRCLCRAGVSGPRCDQCQQGHCGSYPGCQLCHPCFHSQGGAVQRLRQRQAGLANATARLPPAAGGSQLGPRLSRALQDLQQARAILGHPAGALQGLAQAGSALAAVREQVRGINPDLHFLDDTASLSRELQALNSSLIATSSQYQSKKTQFESSRSTDLAGAFQTIRSAYQSSSSAGSLAQGAPGLLAQARESRRSAAGLQRDLAASTARLVALQGQLASAPDLTPAINQVCGGARVEPCTPARCPGLLCPRDNSSVCGAGQPCHGLFPLASGALAAAGQAAKEFSSLSARLQDTAQLVKTTELSAGQIRSSTRRLAEQLAVTRTQIQGDVRRVRQLLQRLRGFLADKDTDPASIQEISESVLSLRLPTDAAAVRRRMAEIQRLATALQCPEDILAQTAEDIARAKRLQQEAEQARNRAKAVEGSVEEVLGTLQRASTVLLEAQGALRGSGSSLRFIQERLDEIEAVLGPAEKNVVAMGAGLAGLAERLLQLQRGTEQNRLRAGDTQDTAGTAAQRASSAQQAFAQVKELYLELQSRVGQGPALGEQGRRVQSIGREAQALLQDTMGIMLRMETLESEIQEGNKALVSRMSRLSGLEEQVGRIRDSIKSKVAYYESCS
ncbi:laminin subunit beta-3 isoform X2 [Oenanthe melanoleuca]|uniref:laminin subunit beta-3 isoform X2 n=1 Tax=Oenanthe melanoleuca TaxID=2939378 RepID=UPI0024C20AD0|nr:laminin subunit beta-3 isoform X2 [Oenanthe melanoleuca]